MNAAIHSAHIPSMGRMQKHFCRIVLRYDTTFAENFLSKMSMTTIMTISMAMAMATAHISKGSIEGAKTTVVTFAKKILHEPKLNERLASSQSKKKPHAACCSPKSLRRASTYHSLPCCLARCHRFRKSHDLMAAYLEAQARASPATT